MGPSRQAMAMALGLVLLPGTVEARAERLIVVVTDGWNAPRGQLRRFLRPAGGAPWEPVGEPVAVVVGKSGLGWGRGSRPRPPQVALDGPGKREGDGRAPAGRFALGDLTGYDEAAPAGARLRYRQATPALRCVDDPGAPAVYNRLVDEPAPSAASGGAAPWSSAERMRRDDELYRLTLFVRHNDARIPGAGSCIFLHVWADAATPTVGCTAMALADLRALVVWADAGTELVQLPRPVYRRLERAWDLPPLQRK
jgi:hypothetical protein